MLLAIPEVLTPEAIIHCRKVLSEANWIDGRATAGYQSAQVKNNLQLPEDHPASRILQDVVLDPPLCHSKSFRLYLIAIIKASHLALILTMPSGKLKARPTGFALIYRPLYFYPNLMNMRGENW
jgi:hypothetical protein